MADQELNGSESIFLKSNGNFDLRSVPFSIYGSYLCIMEDRKERSLYLSISRSPTLIIERKNLIKIVPVIDNKEIPFEYFAEPAKLTIKTYKGTSEICFDGHKQLRIRGKGISLRFYVQMKMFENCSPKENGDFEIAYELLGKLLFVPLSGAIWCNAKWNHNTVQADDFILDMIPSVETQKFEAAIHEFPSNGNRAQNYVSFDKCVEKATQEFNEFSNRFKKVPKKYSHMAKLAAWTIWTHHVSPQGRLHNTVVYTSRTEKLRAFAEHQSYHAMASSENAIEAWGNILSMFEYHNSAGQIPNNVSDISIDYSSASPVVQGIALDYIYNFCDLSIIEEDKYINLYSKLSGYALWWLEKRDRNNSGIPQYYNVNESELPRATVFKKGLPVQSGDLLAFLVLLTEYCGKIAVKVGEVKQSENWMKESKRLLDVLIDKFWDGNKFISILAETGEKIESSSITSLIPIVLGHRLPDDIINTIEDHLMSEDMYLTPGGIASESLRSPDFKKYDSLVRGNIFASIQLMLSIGLLNSGKKASAYQIAARYCDLVCEKGFSNMLTKLENEIEDGLKFTGDSSLQNEDHSSEKIFEWTSDVAAIFLIMASNIPGNEQAVQ